MLVIDGHTGSGITESYIGPLRLGGVDSLSLAIGWMKDAYQTLRDMQYLYSWVDKHCKDVMIVTTASEIEQAKRTGKIGVILEFENIMPLGGNLRLLDIFARLGVRVIQLAYNERNVAADGCTERTDAGLSDFGVQLIERMNELRILVSLSHTGRASTMDAMAVSEAPVIFSHSNVRALVNNPRNIDDEQIKAVATTNGVVGVAAGSEFLSETDPSSVTLDDFLNHIGYIVDLVGVDHVAIGLDMVDNWSEFEKTGIWDPEGWDQERYDRVFKPTAHGSGLNPGESVHGLTPVTGLERIEKLPKVTEGLLRRKYSPEEVAKVMGGNLLRVYREVWGE